MISRTGSLWGTLWIVVSVTAARAQAPAPTTPNILDNRIDVLLREWSAKSTQIQSLYTEFKRTTVDHAFKTAETHKGSARYLAPNKARLDIHDVESYVLTGAGEIWEYKPPLSQITVYELPPEIAAKENLEDGPLPFLIGANPQKVKSRYKLTLVSENEETIQLNVIPKHQNDLANFSSAEITLKRDTFLPSKLKFMEPNQNIVTFEFEKFWTNIKINPDDFVGRPVTGADGKDWKLVRKRPDFGDEDKSGKARRPPAQAVRPRTVE